MTRLHSDIKKYFVFRALLKRIVLPILVLYGIDKGLSLGELAMIAAAGSIASTIFEVPSGAFADQIGHKKALVISMLGQAVSMALYFGGSFWWILAGTVCYFLFGTLMTGTSEAIFFERVRELGLEEQHGKLYGQAKGFATAVSIVSVLLAGIFYEIAWWLPFAVGVLQFLVAALLIGTMQAPSRVVSVSKKEGQVALFSNFKEAVRAVWGNPRAFWLVILSGLLIGPLFGLGDFQQALMMDVGMTASIIGFVYAGKRLCSVAMQAFAHRLKEWFGTTGFVVICTVLTLAHLSLVAVIKQPLFLVIPLLVGSMVWGALEVTVNDTLNRMLETHARATALSLANFVRNLIQLSTIALFGFLTIGHSAAFAYGTIAIILTISLAFPFVRFLRVHQKS